MAPAAGGKVQHRAARRHEGREALDPARRMVGSVRGSWVVHRVFFQPLARAGSSVPLAAPAAPEARVKGSKGQITKSRAAADGTNVVPIRLPVVVHAATAEVHVPREIQTDLARRRRPVVAGNLAATAGPDSRDDRSCAATRSAKRWKIGSVAGSFLSRSTIVYSSNTPLPRSLYIRGPWSGGSRSLPWSRAGAWQGQGSGSSSCEDLLLSGMMPESAPVRKSQNRPRRLRPGSRKAPRQKPAGSTSRRRPGPTTGRRSGPGACPDP